MEEAEEKEKKKMKGDEEEGVRGVEMFEKYREEEVDERKL